MKRNVTGNLLVCFECEPPWVGTIADGFDWGILDDCCPQCGNTDLEDILTDLEPEEYAAELATQQARTETASHPMPAPNPEPSAPAGEVKNYGL